MHIYDNWKLANQTQGQQAHLFWIPKDSRWCVCEPFRLRKASWRWSLIAGFLGAKNKRCIKPLLEYYRYEILKMYIVHLYAQKIKNILSDSIVMCQVYLTQSMNFVPFSWVFSTSSFISSAVPKLGSIRVQSCGAIGHEFRQNDHLVLRESLEATAFIVYNSHQWCGFGPLFPLHLNFFGAKRFSVAVPTNLHVTSTCYSAVLNKGLSLIDAGCPLPHRAQLPEPSIRDSHSQIVHQDRT